MYSVERVYVKQNISGFLRMEGSPNITCKFDSSNFFVGRGMVNQSSCASEEYFVEALRLRATFPIHRCSSTSQSSNGATPTSSPENPTAGAEYARSVFGERFWRGEALGMKYEVRGNSKFRFFIRSREDSSRCAKVSYDISPLSSILSRVIPP
jgi:hypothetical protein